MIFRALCLSVLVVSTYVGVANGASNAANDGLPIIIGPLLPVHIGPPPLPWPPTIPIEPVPIHPWPPLPTPHPIVPGQGCVPAPGTACPL
jgi:hypothetical protein